MNQVLLIQWSIDRIDLVCIEMGVIYSGIVAEGDLISFLISEEF